MIDTVNKLTLPNLVIQRGTLRLGSYADSVRSPATNIVYFPVFKRSPPILSYESLLLTGNHFIL
jgi:hypothetical protein